VQTLQEQIKVKSKHQTYTNTHTHTHTNARWYLQRLSQHMLCQWTVL